MIKSAILTSLGEELLTASQNEKYFNIKTQLKFASSQIKQGNYLNAGFYLGVAYRSIIGTENKEILEVATDVFNWKNLLQRELNILLDVNSTST